MTIPGVPPEAAVPIRAAADTLGDEIIAAVAREIPEYARPLEGPFGDFVREGVRRALDRFADTVELAERDDRRVRELYVEIGRAEAREGRSLDALQAAYRLGARIAWRRLVHDGAAAGLAPEIIYRLGEAIWSYIDGLAAESVEGWASERAALTGERRRRREGLLRALVAGELTDPAALREPAEAAGWPVPSRVAALVAAGPGADRAAPSLPATALAADLGEETVVLLAEPGATATADRVAAALRGADGGRGPVALGPPTELIDVGRSIGRARLALRVAAAGRLPADGLLRAEAHPEALLLHRDPALAEDVVRVALGPLAAVGPRAEAKLRATLRTWLDAHGRVEDTARRLGVHPQTVRYRLDQLRELLGGAIDDPDGRFSLALALRLSDGTAKTRAPT